MPARHDKRCATSTGRAVQVLMMLAVTAAAVSPAQSLYLNLPPPLSQNCTATNTAQSASDTCSIIANKTGIPLPVIQAINAAAGATNCSSPLQAGQLVCTSSSYTVTCGASVATALAGETCDQLAQRTTGQTINGQPQYFLNNALVTRLNQGPCSSPLKAGTPICLPANPGYSMANSYTGGSSSRRLLAPSPSSSSSQCVGNSYIIKSTDNVQSCTQLANITGLQLPTLQYLNPSLNGTTCNVQTGFSVCLGCTGIVCKTQVSTAMSTFLNYPAAFNAAACALLVNCKFQQAPALAGTPNTLNETMTLVNNAPNNLTSNSTFPAVNSFFASPNGTYYATGPNPALEIVLQPNYGPQDANGYYQGLFQFNALTQSTSRRLLSSSFSNDISQEGTLVIAGPGRGLLGTVTTRQSQNPQSTVSSTYN